MGSLIAGRPVVGRARRSKGAREEPREKTDLDFQHDETLLGPARGFADCDAVRVPVRDGPLGLQRARLRLHDRQIRLQIHALRRLIRLPTLLRYCPSGQDFYSNNLCKENLMLWLIILHIFTSGPDSTP